MGRNFILPGGASFNNFIYVYTRSNSGSDASIGAVYVEKLKQFDSVSAVYSTTQGKPISFHGIKITYGQTAGSNWGIYAEQKCFIPTESGKAYRLPGDLIAKWPYYTGNGLVIFL